MSFYPINPDTAVESFLLINKDEQITQLGQQYNLSELVPLNYRKVMDAAIDPGSPINFVPVRELVYISNPYKIVEIDEEFTYLYQSSSLLISFQQASNYYVGQVMKYFSAGAGVITEIKTDLIPNTDISQPNSFFIQHKLKIEWFVVPGSEFS